MLQPCDQAIGYKGKGDFELLKDGMVYRPSDTSKYSYIYAGLSILKPSLIKMDSRKVFSLSEYYLRANKVHGTVADCEWYHVSSPEDIGKIESVMFR